MRGPVSRRSARSAWAWAVVTAALAGLAVGCNNSSNGNNTTPANSTITIVSGARLLGMAAFSPPSDTVHVGNIVRLHNGDSITHTIQPVTVGGPSWGNIAGGTDRDITVNATGVFQYKCVIAGHNMTGELVVLP